MVDYYSIKNNLPEILETLRIHNTNLKSIYLSLCSRNCRLLFVLFSACQKLTNHISKARLAYCRLLAVASKLQGTYLYSLRGKVKIKSFDLTQKRSRDLLSQTPRSIHYARGESTEVLHPGRSSGWLSKILCSMHDFMGIATGLPKFWKDGLNSSLSKIDAFIKIQDISLNTVYLQQYSGDYQKI